MKTLVKHTLLGTLGCGAVILAFTLPAHAGESGSDSRNIEETTVITEGDAILRRAPGVPGSAVDHRARTVSFGDLNLDRQAGLDSLYLRLETAARAVCEPTESVRNTRMRSDWRQCYGEAMDGAVDEIGHFGLQQYHLAKTSGKDDSTEQVAGR